MVNVTGDAVATIVAKSEAGGFFHSSSGGATLPVTLRTVEHRIGVNNNVAAFAVPLGATINMDGTAIMQGVATVFIAQFFGYQLGVDALLMVVLTATLASIGTAAVPGVGLYYSYSSARSGRAAGRGYWPDHWCRSITGYAAHSGQRHR